MSSLGGKVVFVHPPSLTAERIQRKTGPGEDVRSNISLCLTHKNKIAPAKSDPVAMAKFRSGH